MPQRNLLMKMIIAGAGAVGKTTLLNRVITGTFDSQTAMTIGVDFHVLNLTVDNKAITLQLWDLGGQERFRFMVDGYITGAKVISTL